MRLIYRRDFLAWSLLGSMSLTSKDLKAQTRLEKSKISVALRGRSDIPLLPLTIADRLGFIRAEGLSVELLDFASATDALQAVINGSAQIGASGFEQTLALGARGHFLQSFVLMGKLPAIAVGVSTRTLPHFKTVADLKGKRVGVGDIGSVSHAIAALVIKQAGLLPTDVTLVHLESADDALLMFMSNQIDGLSYGDPVMTQLEQKKMIHLVADCRTTKGTQTLLGSAVPGACLYAHGAFLQQNPATVQALSNAVIRALRWLQTASPNDLMKVIPDSFVLGDRVLYLTAINKGRDAVSSDGLMPKFAPVSALALFKGLDTIAVTEPFNLEKTFTNDFAKAANSHFKV